MIFSNGPAAASASGDQDTEFESAASAFEAAPAKSAAAKLTSLIAVAASTASGPKSIRMERIGTSIQKDGAPVTEGTTMTGAPEAERRR
jgi:hypothetical protein